jgi:hypothetical protein
VEDAGAALIVSTPGDSRMNRTTNIVMIGMGVLLLAAGCWYVFDPPSPQDAQASKDRQARAAYEDACHVQFVNTGKACPPYEKK